jgi:hypothetical protein
MRNLFSLLVIALCAYYGWRFWKSHPEVFARFLPSQATSGETEPAAPTGSDGAPPQVTQPTQPPPPVFASKIVVPEDAEKLPPGEFFVLDRASVETATGVIAVVPGDRVKLLDRKGDGTLKVTNGQADFTLNETQVTQDVATAQAAEKADWESRYLRR